MGINHEYNVVSIFFWIGPFVDVTPLTNKAYISYALSDNYFQFR